MRIRKPRYLSTTDIYVATILGVISGIYIWKPIFSKYKDPEYVASLTNTTEEPAAEQQINK